MLLYDTDSGVNPAAKRTFTVIPGKSTMLTAAGLAPTECVQVYVRVGEATTVVGCSSCPGPADWIWAPLFRCGKAVELCGTNNSIVESLPGTYMIGPVTPDPVFAGDVNIAAQDVSSLSPEVLSSLGKCEPSPDTPLPVEVISTCAAPVFVEVCNPTQVGIELGFAPLGCVVDGDGNITAKVFMCKTAEDVVGAAPSFNMVSVALDGTVTNPYTGTWVDCAPPPPVIERRFQTYLERNGGTVTMADIVAASGAAQVHSVTVKQISGTGTVTGDSGSGVPMSAGETWSWSVVSQDNLDTLSSSNIVMDAGGGEQRITATYTL